MKPVNTGPGKVHDTPCHSPDGMYVGYSESKYRLCISPADPRDCHFVHVQ